MTDQQAGAEPVTDQVPGEFWPAWLADLTPEDRVREIVSLHAHWCHGADGRCSGSEAVDLLLRLLGEARQQAPVPSAGHSQAIAALHRLALDEPMTELKPGNHAWLALEAEMTARREHAAGTLETITRMGAEAAEAPREPQGGNPAAEVPPGPASEHEQHAVRLKIRAERERQRMTQAGLAATLGVTQTAVSYWEAGKREIGTGDLLAIARALGVKPASLLPGPDPESGEAETDPPSLPPGQFARVELMGHNPHTGWVTDGTRAGVPVMVISDWDGQVIAEAPGASLYRYVPLPTPQKRPEPQRAITGTGDTFGFAGLVDDDPDGDYGWGDDGDDG